MHTEIRARIAPVLVCCLSRGSVVLRFPARGGCLRGLSWNFPPAFSHWVAPPSGRIETRGEASSWNFFLWVKLLTLYDLFNKCMEFLLDSRHRGARGAQSTGSVTATYSLGERG